MCSINARAGLVLISASSNIIRSIYVVVFKSNMFVAKVRICASSFCSITFGIMQGKLLISTIEKRLIPLGKQILNGSERFDIKNCIILAFSQVLCIK